jgi:hypothetical protein
MRLIDLEAGEDKREIRCFLKEWDRDDNPSYAALSYPWGELSFGSVQSSGAVQKSVVQ